MADEIPKISDFSGNLESRQFESRLSRLLQSINQFFKRQDPVDSKLVGRINELQTTADKYLIELLDFKDMLEKENKPQIFLLGCGIIDPLITEIARIQRIMGEQESAAMQVKTFHRCVAWIEKAKYWVELKNQNPSSRIIEESVFAHIIKEFHARIDRDIQVVQDYLAQALNSFEVDQYIKHHIKEKLDPDLSPYLNNLQMLKQQPEDLTLDKLSLWRIHADQAREKNFGQALHIIDGFINEYRSPNGESETEKVVESILHLSILEENIANLAINLEEAPLNEALRKSSLNLLDRFEDEAHLLNQDLRLSYEDGERVQAILETIAKIRETFG